MRALCAASVSAVALSLGACHARAGTSAPFIIAIVPDSVNIGGGAAPLLTVRGRGFAARNTVHFGALRIPDVSRTSDSIMQFAVPTDDTFLPNRGPAPVTPLAAGRYEVRVANAAGTSNAVAVMLRSAQGAR
ncbi:hypothetical protein [Gemmatimonas sp.]